MRIHDCLIHYEDTGTLVWKERPIDHFSTKGAWIRWNKLFAGKKAGTNHEGILQIRWRGKSYQSARIAIEILTGLEVAEDAVVQYKDGNADNLRRDNLVVVPRSEFSRELVIKYARPHLASNRT